MNSQLETQTISRSDDAYLSMLKKQLRKDLDYIHEFCETNLITFSVANFLTYKEEKTMIPKCVSYFFGQTYCRFFFFNSRRWQAFYNNLPPDFQRDIATSSEIKTINLLTAANEDIDAFLRKALKSDYIRSN